MLNRQLQFSIQALLCATLISAIAITYWGSRRHAIDPRWREEVFYDCESLENEPSVVVDAIDRIAFDDIYRTRAKITVNNIGKTTLIYSGYAPNHIRTFQEFFCNGRWTMDGWEWCGTGASKFEILPNHSASFEVWFRDDERRERVLGGFTEKGTNRSGLAILATEPRE